MITPWYALAYAKLDRIAMRHGYCLALHGTMARDLDLVAVPWTDDADTPDKLIKAFCRHIGGGKVNLNTDPMAKKPHGRMAYSIPIGHHGYYLDISVMPRKTK